MELDKPGSTSLITFRLDPASGVPPYMQLVSQVEHALRLGYLVAGDQLPRVKDAVALLAINPNTVLKAYGQLEKKGLVVGRPGKGTYIRAEVEVVPLRDQKVLLRALDRWLSSATTAGLDEAGIAALFATALHKHGQQDSGSAAS